MIADPLNLNRLEPAEGRFWIISTFALSPHLEDER